jgi:hypothetical protein
VCLALPVSALAAADQESLFMDDNRLMYRGAQVTQETFSELRALGVDRVRLSVHWRVLAPEDRPPTQPGDPASYPASNFDPLDFTIEQAAAHGIAVLLNVTGGAPDWATGKKAPKSLRPGIYKPDVRGFGAFTEMLGRRYSGEWLDESDGQPLPRVSAWSIWNEPNWGNLLQPQWEATRTTVRTRKGKRSIITGWTPRAPHVYRALYRAATAGLQRSGHGEDTILLGETAPLGSRYRGADQHLRPMTFLRELFCLDRKLRPLKGHAADRRGCDFEKAGPLRATGYAHHPYSIESPPATSFLDADTAVLADRGRLYGVLDRAAEVGRATAGLRLWITEYGYQTNPPDPGRGVTLAEQARWLSESELITWGDPRVAAHAQFLLRDDDPNAKYPASDRRYWGTYQSGLQYADGTHKPAYDAYRLPFFAPARVSFGEPLRMWGMVRAAPNATQQPVELQWRPDASTEWQTLTAFVIEDARGYFTYTLDTPRGGDYRFVWEDASPASPRVLPGDPPPSRYASAPAAVAVG